MIGTKVLLALAFMIGETAGVANAIELGAATLDAWRDYLGRAEAHMQTRLEAEHPFLWIDESPDRAARLRRGEIVVAPLVGQGTQDVPQGLIHDWIGATFIRNASIETLQAVVHDYDRYRQIYKPVVADSKALSCDRANQEFSMIWQRRVLFVGVAMEGHYEAHDFSFGPRRGYTVVDATRVQQIEDSLWRRISRGSSDRLNPQHSTIPALARDSRGQSLIDQFADNHVAPDPRGGDGLSANTRQLALSGRNRSK